MARHIASVIDEIRPRFSAAVESSISPDHDLEITEHGLGFDIAQNGLVTHVDHAQAEIVAKILKGDS